MADNVRFILDNLASLFSRMEESTIYSHSEVKAIVKKITDFEYILKRRVLEVESYYSYIQYLLKLEQLRQTRTVRLGLLKPSREKQQQELVRSVESAFVSHTAYVFNRAVRRFPQELQLYNDFIAFLKNKKATKLLNQLFGSVLALHPNHEEFWIQASVHEIEAQQNIHAARTLMQRGLRVNQRSAQLWQRYFELEAWHALRSIERQHALGLTVHGEDLLGAPLIVFNHALKALLPPSTTAAISVATTTTTTTTTASSAAVACVLQMLQTGSDITQPLANSMEKSTVASLHGVAGADEIWQFLLDNRLQRTLDEFTVDAIDALPPSTTTAVATDDDDVSQQSSVGRKRTHAAVAKATTAAATTDAATTSSSVRAVNIVARCLQQFSQFIEIVVAVAGNSAVIDCADVVLLCGHLLVDKIAAFAVDANVSISKNKEMITTAAAVPRKKSGKGKAQSETETAATSVANSELQFYSSAFTAVLSMLMQLQQVTTAGFSTWEGSLQLLRMRLFRYCSLVGGSDQQDNNSSNNNNSFLLSEQQFADYAVATMKNIARTQLQQRTVATVEAFALRWSAAIAEAIALAVATATSQQQQQDVATASKSKLLRFAPATLAALCYALQIAAPVLCCYAGGERSIQLQLLPLLRIMDDTSPLSTSAAVAAKATVATSAVDTEYLKAVAHGFDAFMSEQKNDSKADRELLQLYLATAEADSRWLQCCREVIVRSSLQLPSSTRCLWCAQFISLRSIRAEDDESDSEKADEDDAAAAAAVATSIMRRFEWVMTCAKRRPHQFSSDCLAPVFDAVLKALPGSNTIIYSATLPAEVDGTTPVAAMCERQAVLQRAVQLCPGVARFWQLLEQAQYAAGDAKAAQHTRWRKQQLSKTSS